MDPQLLISLLNQDLAREYRAALLYKSHAACLNGSFFAVIDVLYEHAEDELKHARLLSEHINFLGGIPTAEGDAPDIAFGNLATLTIDLAGEQDAITRYRERIAQVRQSGDYGTEVILLSILQDEESHYNDIAAILDMPMSGATAGPQPQPTGTPQ